MWDKNIRLVLVAGAVIALVVVGATVTWGFTYHYGVVKDFQGLIGSCVTLCSAFVAWYFVERQIRKARENSDRQNATTLLNGERQIANARETFERQAANAREESERATMRKRFASKALLPSALTEISEHAERIVNVLDIRSRRENGTTALTIASDRLELASISRESLATLKESIEVAPAEFAERIAILLRKLQITNSRIRATFNSMAAGEHLSEWIRAERTLDAIMLNAHASELFYYARNEQEPESTSKQFQIMSYARQSGIREETHPAVFDLIRRRFPLEPQFLDGPADPAVRSNPHD